MLHRRLINDINSNQDLPETSLVTSTTKRCFFCRNSLHPHLKCSARDATCRNCRRKVCKSIISNETNNKHAAFINLFVTFPKPIVASINY